MENPYHNLNKDFNVERLARFAHEINRAYCQSIGDNSQESWQDAPLWQKESAISGVKMHLANPDATPADSHNSWVAQKIADGWVYGVTKDPSKKTHPCIVHYEELPDHIKSKDYLFKAVVDLLSGGG